MFSPTQGTAAPKEPLAYQTGNGSQGDVRATYIRPCHFMCWLTFNLENTVQFLRVKVIIMEHLMEALSVTVKFKNQWETGKRNANTGK